jgi:hypothetical protein
MPEFAVRTPSLALPARGRVAPVIVAGSSHQVKPTSPLAGEAGRGVPLNVHQISAETH